MTNAELLAKIKAEIERLKKNENELIENSTKKYGAYPASSDIMLIAYQNVLSILSTLESEKPMNQDELEEELERFIASGKSVTVDDYGTYKVSYHDFKKVARHFAQWGAEHLKK